MQNKIKIRNADVKNRNPDILFNSEKIQELSGKENREIKECPVKLVQVHGA